MVDSKTIVQSTKWSAVSEVLAKIASPLANVVLARLLAPEVFGLVASFTVVTTFAEVFTDAGFQKYIIQHGFQDEEELNRSTDVAFWTNLLLSLFLCAVIFIFRHALASLVGSPGLGNSISIASVLILIAAFSSIQMARYKRDFDFKTLFFVRISTACIPLVVTIPLAFLLKNYWALLIGTFVSQLFSAVVLTVKSKWKPRFYYDVALFKEMFSFSAWTLLESVSIWLTSYIGVFIVGRVLDDYYLGLYKTSMATINSYMAIITAAIMPVLFSALSRYQNDEANFKATFYRFQRLTAMFVIPMGVGIFLYSDLATRILLGEQWMEASGFIGLWGLTSAFVIVFSNIASEVYRGKGNPKISLFMQLFHLSLLIPTLLLSVSHGFVPLYISRSLIRLEGIPRSLIVLALGFGIKISHVLKNILPSLLSALVMGAVGYGLLQISSAMVWQLASVVICVIVYFAFLLVCFPKIRREVLSVSYVRGLVDKIKK